MTASDTPTPDIPAVWNALTFQAGYNTSVVMLATTLLGLAAGVVGTFAILRKRSLTADALSHATLPGVVLAFLLADAAGADAKSLPLLLAGAAATAVAGVLAIHAIARHTRLSEDAAIGIVLSVFFGAGVVLLSVAQHAARTPPSGLHHFIYGQTAAMNARDTAIVASIATASLLIAFLFLKELRAVCFDPAFARVLGVPVTAVDLTLLTLVVLVTVAGLQAVGMILVVALLIVPAAAARFWSDRLGTVVAVAAAFGALSGYAGSALSSLLSRQPAGAVIILTAGALFAFSMLAAPRRGVIASALRTARLRCRIAADHALESLARAHDDPDAPADDARIGPALGLYLALAGHVRRRHSVWALTPRGLERGRRVARNHRLWEQYLVLHADVAPSHVDWSVDRVEHVLSPEMVARLERLIEAQEPTP